MQTLYFAGSIRGGRQDSEIYRKLIDHLRTYGPVLTEHVGDDELLRQEKKMSEQEIFARDMEWLRRSEVMVAEVSVPSLGVGYEIALAQALGKKIVCLCRKSVGNLLSAMIAGNPALILVRYDTLEEAQALIDTHLQQN